MHLLFASSRINITVLNEQQLEGSHVAASLFGSLDEITCIPLTVLNGEEKCASSQHARIVVPRLIFLNK
jgi:hypothetical protein